MLKSPVHIEIDEQSGFCFGVVNAISRAEETVAAGGKVYSLGDIVHNRLEVQRLEKLGLGTVGHERLAEAAGHTVVIRAHGEPPSTYEAAERLGIRLVDATCPVVAKLQQVVADAYAMMQKCGGQVVILGKKGHAEVVGLAGHAEGNAIIIEGEADLERIDFSRPVFFLSQTTQSLDLFEALRDKIYGRAADAAQVVVRDTICRQVSNREAHLRDFARRFDAVLFVSGRKSSNGRVLYEVCRGANANTHLIEEAGEVQPEWLEGCHTIGICGATSTPHWLMTDVATHVKQLYE